MTEASTTADKTATGRTRTTGEKANADRSATPGADLFSQSQATFEDFFRASTEAMSGNYEKWFGFGKERLAAAFEAFSDWDDLTELGKENAQALVASSKIAAEGFEEITDRVMGYATTAVEDGVTTSRALLECRDVKAAADLQTERVRKLVDCWVAESAELSEISVRTATKAMAPLSERVDATIRRWASPAL